MQNGPWREVFRRIPEELHHQLSLLTCNGTEIIIQSVISMRGECFVFKGRMSGSQDTGRVFFVPFDQIDHLSTLQPIAEEDCQEWFEDAGSRSASNGQTSKEKNPKEDKSKDGSGIHQLNSRQAALLDRVRSRSQSKKEEDTYSHELDDDEDED